MNGSHTHDNPERLTFGCPACIRRVKQDQWEAALAEQPPRLLTVEWRATATQSGTSIIEVQAMPSEKPSEVADRVAYEIDRSIAGCLDWDGCDWDYTVDELSLDDAEVDA